MTDNRPDGLLRSGALLSSTALVTAAIGLLRSKVIALVAGPAGVGVLAQMNQVALLVGACCSLGLGTICVKLIAEARERGDDGQERRLVALVLGLPVALSSLLLLLVLPFLAPLADLLLGSRDLALELFIALASVPLNVLLVSASAVLLGWGRGAALSVVTLSGSVLGTVLTVGLVLTGGRSVVVWTVLVTSLAPAVVLVLLQPQVVRHLSVHVLPDLRYRGMLRGPAAGTLISMALFYGAETVTRARVLGGLGAEANGLYQPVSLLRTQLMTPLVAGVVVLLLPSLTRLLSSGNRDGAAAELRLAWRVVLLFVVPICLLLVAFREVYVFAAFSSEFGPAGDLVLLQMPGEVLIAAVVVLNAALLPAGHPSWYFAVNVLTILVQVTLSVLLLPVLGVSALIVGFVAANAVALGLHWWVLSGSGLLPRAHVWLVVVGTGLVAATGLLVRAVGRPGEVAAVAAAVGWLFLASSASERAAFARKVRQRLHAAGGVDRL